MASEAQIRLATLADIEAITNIYNQAILTTTATFDLEPKSLDDRRRWFESHDERHPILVAELNGQVVGWGALSKWSDRQAYDETAETSFYVQSEFRRQGIGRKLKQALIDEAKRIGFHSLIARVAEGSGESLHINESVGFQRVGVLREVGKKFGKRLDVHILQLMLE